MNVSDIDVDALFDSIEDSSDTEMQQEDELQLHETLDLAVVERLVEESLSSKSSLSSALSLQRRLRQSLFALQARLIGLISSAIPEYDRLTPPELTTRQFVHVCACYINGRDIDTLIDQGILSEPQAALSRLVVLRAPSTPAPSPLIDDMARFADALENAVIRLDDWLASETLARYPNIYNFLANPRVASVLASCVQDDEAGRVNPGDGFARRTTGQIKMVGKAYRLSQRRKPQGGVLADIAADIVEENGLDEKKMGNRILTKLANKFKLVAAVDIACTDPEGSFGQKTRDQVLKAFENSLAPNQKITQRQLKIAMPGDKKKHRAGRKYNARRRRTQMTAVRERANRVAFGQGSSYAAEGMV
ncbi:Prp31 C terminal domain [Carpediemonas membranifera]|uniref:Prp31 C terminal domain n=1 Tax=Carpediemonas membranifera TaxID=201153 RepID=A0A8J6B942_9EUKA|nr:Prp31 C terminal domain [Carpediemonas membranifera]|eukprot:KAG9395327.1 Prp31 C terminal domain [Carpediemonas membranifera]